MRPWGALVAALAIGAWVAVGVALGTGAFSGSHTVVPPSGVSPACLPATLTHSAALAGSGLDVSPAPGTDTANPRTQISFLGAPVADVQDVSVEGSRSGQHAGALHGYSQGDGGSFLPARPFDAGEQVTVRATLGAPGHARRVAFSFGIATPYPTAGLPGFPNPPAPPSAYQSFASAPGLHPPILDITAPDRDPAAGDLLMTVGPGPGQYGALIYAPDGRLEWFYQQPSGVNVLNLSVQRYAGGGALTFWQGKVLALGFGQGEDVVMDGNYRVVATVRAGNGYQADLHDFQIAPDQVAYVTVYNVIRCNLAPVGGARNGVIVDTAVQALDMRTGLVRWEWHALDHVGVRGSHAPVASGAAPWDWFHLNSIDAEPDGDVLISARSTWAAYQLEAGSGRILWQLGGTGSSFAMGPGAETAWQHDARLQPDGTVTAFDDGATPRVHYQSRGVQIALDPGRRTASLVRSYPHPGAPLVSDSQGNMQALPDQSVVIGWGSVPSVTQLAPNGEILLDAHMPPGTSSYRAFRAVWHGQPLWLPAASARILTTGDATAVFASWNGATDVASWRVLAGAQPGSLSAQVTMPDSGFESSITFPGAFAYVAVQALGPSGNLLATSPTVRVQQPATPPGTG